MRVVKHQPVINKYMQKAGEPENDAGLLKVIIIIPSPLVSVLFLSSIPTFCSFKKMFFVLYVCILEHV